MPISGEHFVDAAPRARSTAALTRTIVRLIVLLGGAVAALLFAASTASADDGSTAQAHDGGLAATVGSTVAKTPVVKVVPPKVVPAKVVVPKVVPPKVEVHKAVTAPVQRVTKQAVETVATTTQKTVQNTVQTVAPKSLKQVTNKVSKAVAPVTHAAENLQPTQGIPGVDGVTEDVTKALGHTSAAPPDQAVAAAVLPPSSKGLSRHHRATSEDAGSLVATGVLASSQGPSTKAGSLSGSQLRGAFPGVPTGLPTDVPHLPTAPAQAPVVQMGSGQTAGELAVFDAVLRDGSNGPTRLDAGDEGAPLSRALVVDTRPA